MIAQILLMSCIFATLNANVINRDKLPRLPLNEFREEIVENREKREIGSNMINLDPVAIKGQINSLRASADSRSSFVKGVLNCAFYGAEQAYNVMVFNLNQHFQYNFNGVKMFHTANFGGVTYGVWIFEAGVFQNKGDGGWDNWGFMGWYDRYNKLVTFRWG